jgi:hypothetical protein
VPSNVVGAVDLTDTGLEACEEGAGRCGNWAPGSYPGGCRAVIPPMPRSESGRGSN